MEAWGSFGNTHGENELFKNSIPKAGFAKDFKLSDHSAVEG